MSPAPVLFAASWRCCEAVAPSPTGRNAHASGTATTSRQIVPSAGESRVFLGEDAGESRRRELISQA